MSNRNVLSELSDRYVNLFDAVDADFFSPLQSVSITRPEGFVVLLPSRLVAGNGHADLLLAVKCLVEMGANISVVFASAVESESLFAELERKSSLWSLRDRVLFLGELTSAGLRDWYAGIDGSNIS
ncbi:MAG: hypothetical protein ABIU05_24605 [Nitrospirales bacterium]